MNHIWIWITFAATAVALLGVLGWFLAAKSTFEAESNLEGLEQHATMLVRERNEAVDELRAAHNDHERDLKAKDKRIAALTADLDRCQSEKAKLSLNTPKKTG